MSQNYQWPSVSVTATNPSVGLTGSSVPGSATLAGAKDPSNNLQPLKVDSSGNLLTASAAPALQNVNLTQVAGSAIALGQHLMAASLPVVIASDQSTLAISAVSLPLPANAAQETGGHLASIDSKLTSPLSVTQSGTWTTGRTWTLSNGTDSVNVGNFPATQAVTQSTSPWVVSGTVTANAGTGNFTVVQPTGSNLHVVVDSGPASQSVTIAGKASSGFVRNDYTSTNVTTGAYVQLIASTSAPTSELFVFDSSGQTLKLATGAPGLEVDQFLIVPGGNGEVPLAIPSGTRISIRAVSATASVGEIDINLFG